MDKPLQQTRTCLYCNKPYVPVLEGGGKYHHECKALARRDYHKKYWHERMGHVEKSAGRNIVDEYGWDYACVVCGMKHEKFLEAFACCEGDLLSDREPHHQGGGFWYFKGMPEQMAITSSKTTTSTLRTESLGRSSVARAADSSSSTQA